jgi:hypothetical protein
MCTSCGRKYTTGLKKKKGEVLEFDTKEKKGRLANGLSILYQ